MKCINCGTDNKLKDRTANQGRCIKCNHLFAFEPTSMSNIKITDPFFAKAIADISANNTLFFTPKQLLYFLDNRLRKSSKAISRFGWLFFYVFFNLFTLAFIIGPLIVNLAYINFFYQSSKSTNLNLVSRKQNARNLQIIGGIILSIGIPLSLISKSFSLFVIIVVMGMLPIYLGTRQLGRIQLLTQDFLFSQSQVKDWLERWQQINGSILKILPAPNQENTPATVNPDVTAYSFDRLVVCDSASIAQLLIANNFHFENNCAILSISGYPQSIFDTTMQMLRRNPDLKVYAVHDCNPRGIGLVHRLKTNASWFLDSEIVIIDIGLTPRQIIATKRGMFIQSSPESAQAAKQLPEEVRQSLSAEELTWLESGNFVELESFTPQRIIKVLQKGIAGSRNLESDDSSLLFVGDTGNDIYTVQSFG
ncbi:toprim domain-containing protein [Nostoc sp.]